MSRARKWLVGVGASLCALVIAIVALLFWLLYTSSGLRFALDRGVAMMHGGFSYASASGTLAGQPTVTDLRYSDAGGDALHIRTATLRLRPWALLGGRFQVERARIDGVTLELAPSKPSNASSTFSLKPPLAIVLDDTRLTHITVGTSTKPAFTADSLAIAGTWNNRQLVIRQLALRAPAGSADLEGTLAIARGYPGHGTAKIDWTRNDTHYVGTITSQSDGKTAQLHAAFSAPVHIDASASLQLDATHAWTLAVNAPTFDARALPALPTSLKTLALDLHGTGGAHAGKLNGKLTANGYTLLLDPAAFRYDGKTLTLNPLRLHSPQFPGIAVATGAVHLDATPMTFALDVNWKNAQLPATLVGQKLATEGDVKLDGSIARYTVQGALAIGPPGRLSNLQVDLRGTPREIDLRALKLLQKNGGLDVHGSIGLQPHLSWRLDAIARRFDPGTILAGWNGAMDFNLAAEGQLTPQGPKATVKLDKVDGTLRQRSIAGSKADLTIAPGNLLQGSLLLVTGSSRIHAVGAHAARADATVDLDIASLGDWLPDAAGRLQGRFTIKGTWPKLAVAGSLQGNGLRVGARRIATLQLTASVPNLAQPGGNLDLALNGVHASGLDFETVHLRGSGNAASHHVQLKAQGKQVGAALALRGKWDAKAKRWTGSLSDIELSPHGMPAWRQQQPSAVAWQQGALTMSQLCLGAGAAHFCMSADRNRKGAITANYSLQRLPLQLLATLAPGSNPLQASGEISGTGQFAIDANGAINGNANLTASAGSIAYTSSPGRPLLAWSSLGVNVTATGTSQHLRMQGALSDSGHINGDITVSGANRALQGTIDADLRSLAFLEVLSPEIANVHGTLSGNLQLSGTLAAPRFQGRIGTQDFSAELPRAGLKLHDGRFAISGNEQGRLAIQGQIASGKGVLHIDGNTGLAANAPLRLSITGDKVLVADIPAAHVVASPDLHVTRANGVLDLTGSVAIPDASVAVEKLPGQGPAKASPDVVIVDRPKAEQVAPLAMNAEIEVKLGDNVKVQGHGLDGSVHGQLAVRVQPGHTATGRGTIRIDGKYEAYGQHLTIEQGRLLFAGTRLDDPGLDIRAVRKIRGENVTVGLSIRGTAQRPILTVFSDPSMEQAEALSYLVTGRPLNDLKSGEGDTLNTAAQALGGLAGDRIAKSIGSRLGLEAGVSSSEALGGSAFTAGKYLSPRLFLSYGVGLFTPGQVITLRYTLNRFLQFEAENATTGNRASFNYRIEK
ncbi:MAG TPA: translocation/assembly module TamB domain-containing protein [Rhodanobacteraceae bacterium]|nr:translocation/assembly module TamB domain-containing protein [Rhodanobacteraceae bacterium]